MVCTRYGSHPFKFRLFSHANEKKTFMSKQPIGCKPKATKLGLGE